MVNDRLNFLLGVTHIYQPKKTKEEEKVLDGLEMECYWLIQAVVGLFISYRVVRATDSTMLAEIRFVGRHLETVEHFWYGMYGTVLLFLSFGMF